MPSRIIIQWDNKTLRHISEHNVSSREVEIAINGRVLIRSISRKGEKLKELIGECHGRTLFIILKRCNDKYKVVTARDATKSEKKLYKKRGK